MRPQVINRNINLAFKRFFRQGNLIHFQKCKRHLEKRLEWYWKTDPQEVEEQKAYYLDLIEDPNKVKRQMEYISDRWNCVGRIKFMLEVINRGF